MMPSSLVRFRQHKTPGILPYIATARKTLNPRLSFRISHSISTAHSWCSFCSWHILVQQKSPQPSVPVGAFLCHATRQAREDPAIYFYFFNFTPPGIFKLPYSFAAQREFTCGVPNWHGSQIAVGILLYVSCSILILFAVFLASRRMPNHVEER